MSQTETRLIEYKSGNISKIPTTILWKDSRMLRAHSVQASVREIVRMVQSLDVVKVNIIGIMGSGKTTFGRALSHMIHQISEKEYKVPFAIKEFTRTELENLRHTITNLEPVNHILIFDDVSFLTERKERMNEMKQTITEVRHLTGVDTKVIILFIFHYTLGMQKYLRQSNFSYYTSIGSSEMDNMLKIVGIHYSKLLYKFQKLCNTALTKGHFSFNLGSKSKYFPYKYRDPFIPLLFSNTDILKIVVSPKREWIDTFCSVCTKSKERTLKDGVSVENFAKDLEHKFGVQIARNAVRIKLFQNGLNVYPKTVKHALTYMDKYVKDKLPNLQQLADHYEFYNDKTLLSAKYTKDLK